MLRILLLLSVCLLVFVNLSSAQIKKTAFINGKIYTVNKKQPLAESVVVYDNKIIFVGSDSDAKKFIDDNTEVVDLTGKLMLPGFIDNHVHFTSGGFYLNRSDLRPAKSIKEFLEILRNYVKGKEGKWITGGE